MRFRELQANGVDTSDCFERSDLEAKYVLLSEAQKAAGASYTAPEGAKESTKESTSSQGTKVRRLARLPSHAGQSASRAASPADLSGEPNVPRHVSRATPPPAPHLPSHETTKAHLGGHAHASVGRLL